MCKGSRMRRAHAGILRKLNVRLFDPGGEGRQVRFPHSRPTTAGDTQKINTKNNQADSTAITLNWSESVNHVPGLKSPAVQMAWIIRAPEARHQTCQRNQDPVNPVPRLRRSGRVVASCPSP